MSRPASAGREDGRFERFVEIVTSTEFMLPAVFVFMALAIGYSVYFWPPDPDRMSRFMPPPVSGRRIHVAEAVRSKGSVECLPGTETRWVPLLPGRSLGEGDQIRLAEDGRLRLELPRGATVRLLGKGLVQFHPDRIVLRHGAALVENPNGKVDVDVSVPTLDCRGRAVRFLVEQGLASAPSVTCLQGTVQLQSGRRRHSLSEGQQVTCPRMGVLGPVEEKTKEARRVDEAPFESF